MTNATDRAVETECPYCERPLGPRGGRPKNCRYHMGDCLLALDRDMDAVDKADRAMISAKDRG